MKSTSSVDRYDPQTEAENAQKVISNFVNNFGCDEKAFCEAMARDHRTLQQNFTRLCVKWIETLAGMEYFDARNEDSVKLAKKIVETLKDDLYLSHV